MVVVQCCADGCADGCGKRVVGVEVKVCVAWRKRLYRSGRNATCVVPHALCGTCERSVDALLSSTPPASPTMYLVKPLPKFCQHLNATATRMILRRMATIPDEMSCPRGSLSYPFPLTVRKRMILKIMYAGSRGERAKKR